MPTANLHGTAVVLGDRGVLITGRSGSGKTSLAFALIERARASGHFARFVGDDQLLLAVHDGALVVEGPDTIRGLAEVYGLGPTRVSSQGRAVVDLAVDLVGVEFAPRFQDGATRSVAGVALPSLSLAERDARAAVLAIWARLRI
ncbi:HPr kinase/phosphorylase [Arvimicrobium flavum]|uniref:HPr kinase/phosphorylase n=1 Tax=Arvimicrobium flavum TaxID=3393320 RepID=UPI00237B8B1C|nr:HPr kinase/phosphatase C-terminal domain-containing protein [Mesorhizobium shangrilense]